MLEIIGTSNRVLEIDLSAQTTKEFSVTEDDRRMYLGGKGLGLKYLHERITPGSDPLGEKNILAFMMGVLLGTGAPCSGRFAALTKSPLTNLMVSSSCGGPFGMAFKTAGYDGLLISGMADRPLFVTIKADGVEFNDAATLWGKDTRETQALLELEKKDGALVIGPAGENRVLYANIATGHRFLGRGGMGAVMGAKNLKAVIARGGRYKILPRDPKRFREINRKATRYIQANSFTSDAYRNYGTSVSVNYCNQGGALPVDNFRKGSHDQAGRVSGEVMREKYRTKHRTCLPCTIRCGHVGTYQDGSVQQIPEYETIGMLGPNIGIYDTDVISTWNNLCGRMGMDTITTGATLAYLMEAGQKGLIATDLKFGSSDGISDMLNDIAHRRGRGDEAANGTRWLSEKYGGKDFAIQVKGLELAAYDPRGSWGQGLAYAVANRGGCHLSAYMIAPELFFGLLNPNTTRAKARFVHFFENLYAAVNSLHTCQFTTYAYVLEAPLVKYTPRPILCFLMQYLPALAIKLMDFSIFSKLYTAVSGIPMTQWEFWESGERTHILERWMNTREGISRKDDTLPQRFLHEGRESDPDKHTVPIEDMLKAYYRLRGYEQNGTPTDKNLRKLGINSAIKPRSKIFKKSVVQIVHFILGRAMQSASKRDRNIQKEISRWPEGFSAMFKVLPTGPKMTLQKGPKGHLVYRGGHISENSVDMIIFFKNIECAFMVFTAQVGTAQAFVEHRMSLKGDISMAMSLTRCLNIVQTYLYPMWIAKKVIKRVPGIPMLQKFYYRFLIYTLGIPLGF